MGDGGTDPDCKDQHSDWPDDESFADTVDGRLSAIMPRKLFQDDAAVKSGLLQVYVRMKPVPETADTCMVLDHNQLLKATWRNKEAVYKFSRVFQTHDGQDAVYDGTTASLVEDFLHFRQPSAVVMAYGVTSAGKTFTMQGTPEHPGLVPQALKNIFQMLSRSGIKDPGISLSVCEIYNESIHDLLAPAHQRIKPIALRLKEDKSGNITVLGAAQLPVHTAKEALELLRRAAKARQSAGTGVNEHSSRSHAVITIKLCSASQECTQSHDGAAKQSYLHFVDLAGCERVKRTGNSGARLRESVAINSSLMTLARCLEVLRYNQQHPADQKIIPYRESKITHLFKGVLHGNGRFVMVVNVSPASEAFNETKRVLQYAALASKVTMTSEVEHDIAGDAWPAGHAMPAEQATHSAAAADAAAAAAAAASAAQARIEELLDDKADLEYEIDVVERKVELLREELIKSEVEKEQLEADIRAEVQEEMQQLIEQAVAKERAKVAKAEEEEANWRQKADELKQQLERQAAQLQQHEGKQEQLKELQAIAEQAKHTMMLISEHRRLLQQAQEAAAAASEQQEADHTAKAAQLTEQHEQQLENLQQQLSAAKAQIETLRHQAAATQQQVAAEQQTADAAAKRASAERQMLADALGLLEHALQQQQHATTDGIELLADIQQLKQLILAELQDTVQRQQQTMGCAAEEPLAALHGPAAAPAGDGVPDRQQQVHVHKHHRVCDAGSEDAHFSADSCGPADGVTKDMQQQKPSKPGRTRQFTLAGNPAAASAAVAEALQHAEPALPQVQAALEGGVRRSRRQSVAVIAPAEQPQPSRAAGEQGQPADHRMPVAVSAAFGVGAADKGPKRRRRTMAPATSMKLKAAGTAGSAGLAMAVDRRRSSRRHSLNPCSGHDAPAADASGVAVDPAGTEAAVAVAETAAGAAKPALHKLGDLNPILEEEEEPDEQQDMRQNQQQTEQQQQQQESDVEQNAAPAGAPPAEVPEVAAVTATAAAGQQAQPAPTRKRRRACGKGEIEQQDASQEVITADCPHQDQPLSDEKTAQEQDSRKRQKTVGSLQAQQHPQQPQIDEQQQEEQDGGGFPSQVVDVGQLEAAAAAAVTEVQQQPAVVLAADADGNTRRAAKARKAVAARPRKQPKGKYGTAQQPQQLQQVQQLGDRQKIDAHAAEAFEGSGEAPPASKAAAAARAPGAKAPPAPGACVQEELWQPAELVLQDVTRQLLGAAAGRRATYAAAGKSAAAAAGKHKGAAKQQLPHIAGGITPVAFRTRHRGPK